MSTSRETPGIILLLKKENTAAVVNAAELKHGSVQWFKFICRLEFTVGQWAIRV
jgi:hypothetical protein